MNLTDFEEFFGLGDETSPIMMLIWILPVILFVFYGQRIQLMVASGEIKKQIKKLGEYGTYSMKETTSYVKGLPGVGDGADREIAIMADYFTIAPVDMDPAGVVSKVRHVVRTREEYTRRQVEAMLPGSDGVVVARVQTLMEVTASLRMIHRIVNHMYLTAKRQNNYPLILPLQMMLPFVMEEAEAMRDAVDAFKKGQPVGDGVGPAVVGAMMRGLPKKTASYQTVSAESVIEGRRAILLKAEGPAPVVGRPDEALQGIIGETRLDAIVMVDAALKMEGEESGVVSRGFGAAIGGTGAERFRIEEIAVQNDTPVFCVVVKQSVKESITLMSSAIHGAVEPATGHVAGIIRDNTPQDGTVLVIGVGNTGGVGQ